MIIEQCTLCSVRFLTILAASHSSPVACIKEAISLCIEFFPGRVLVDTVMAPQNISDSAPRRKRLPVPAPGEEVVISGMSGRFPESDTVTELCRNLLDKVDMVSDNEAWAKEDGMPKRIGKILNVDRFDQSFFGISTKQCDSMDPMVRISLEAAFEAIVDAGLNPRHLRKRYIGVYYAVSFSESEMTWCYKQVEMSGTGLTGSSRAMFANRISYWLGVNGPSYTIDSGYSGGLYALEHAARSIRDGVCEAAVVAASNLCLMPNLQMQFTRLEVTSMDGQCRPFDDRANGLVRSEAISVLFLQKARDAKRAYATVVHAKTACEGDRPGRIISTSLPLKLQLLREFYDECGVDPRQVDYVEADAYGIKSRDLEELELLDNIFCQGRKGQLLVGSMKSNMGHTESASGICGIIKMILSMETGNLFPNLHYENPPKEAHALQEGRIKVVTEVQPSTGQLFAVNSFGLGGSNAHVLIRRFQKNKVDGGLPSDPLPRLVLASGRTEDAVKSILNDVASRPVDVEFVRLLNDVHRNNTPGHIYRGYSILWSGQPEKTVTDIQYFPNVQRPVWFVFSGMGSQWTGMGRSLMQIPVFAAAIALCDRVLKPKGVDIIEIITTDDPNIFDNILNCFVGIAAIQIGLVDILNTVGIVPDGIIGHSVGELGCAYADGTFTAEQMILAAYSRGLASIETEVIQGLMAAVGLGYRQVKDMCPPEIQVACHNGPDSSTLSGPAENMKAFVAELQAKKVFAKEVNCANIAYHSRYIADAGPKLLQYLKEVITEPKARSSKWVSSSVPESQWNTPEAQLSSAEYHTNNLLGSVLFEEASRHIPTNAVTIEIAPHGLLQAILKRSLNKGTVNVPLTLRGKDSTTILLGALGKLNETGVDVDLSELYPPVEFPVASGTPMIAPLVRWEHSESWAAHRNFSHMEQMNPAERLISVSLETEEQQFYAGHILDGRNLFPASGSLIFAWEALGMLIGQLYTTLNIVFENVKFYATTILPKEGEIKLNIMVQKGSGGFEISESGIVIASGRLYMPEEDAKKAIPLEPVAPPQGEDLLEMTSEDIYKELRLRGYGYQGLFRSLVSVDGTGSTAQVAWNENWVTFVDGLLQLNLLNLDTRELCVPVSIEKLTVDINKHKAELKELEDNPVLPVVVNKSMNIIQSGGIEIKGLIMGPVSPKKTEVEPVLEQYLFIPHTTTPSQPLTLEQTLRVCVHVAVENLRTDSVKAVELAEATSGPRSPLLAPALNDILKELPLKQAKMSVLGNLEDPRVVKLGPEVQAHYRELAAEKDCQLLVVADVLRRPELLKTVLAALVEGGCIIARERPQADVSKDLGIDVIVDQTVATERILLLRKRVQPSSLTILPITEKNNDWQRLLSATLRGVQTHQRVVLVAQGEPLSGVLGLLNCVRKEPGSDGVRCFFILDERAPRFDPSLELYRSQLNKDLAVNVLVNGRWGSYRHLKLDDVRTVKAQHAVNTCTQYGDESSLTWIEGPLDQASSSSPLVHVSWSALNLQDVLVATGRLPLFSQITGRNLQDSKLGQEFSGRTPDGRRVMGIVSGGGISNLVEASQCLLWDVPAAWSLEEAATVPIAYGMALLALVHTGRIEKFKSILIHSGSGGVGQAAINVALHYGLTVYTTVGTQEKRDFLKKQFPQLKDSHIGNSRNTSFEQMIMTATDGNGVDLVLNSLSEEKLQASLRCVAVGGRLMQIGKADIFHKRNLGMEYFLKHSVFHSVQLLEFVNFSEAKKLKVHQLLQDAISKGMVKPLSKTVFGAQEVPAAYRFMKSGQHIGKVLIKINREDKGLPTSIQAEPRYHCHGQSTYVVLGGLGGFGLELVDWLVLRGARKLLLNSRTGIRNGYQSLRVRTWCSYGATVRISTADVSTVDGVTALLKEGAVLGPIVAIFHAGDEQVSAASLTQASLLATGLKLLDAEARRRCPGLQQFVLFSSAASGRGAPGRSAQGLLGAVAERVCEARKASGLPGLAVQLGSVGELTEDSAQLGNMQQQSVKSCLRVMDGLLRQQRPVVASTVVTVQQASDSDAIRVIKDLAEDLGVTESFLRSQIETVLAKLGVDALVAEGIRQLLQREYGLFVASTDIYNMTVLKIQELVELNNQRIQSGTGAPDVLLHLLDSIPAELPSYPLVVRLPSAGASGEPVFAVPGVVGVANVLESLASKLSSPTIALQLGLHSQGSTVQDLAAFLLPHVISQLVPGAPFSLLGHSFGGLLVLELAMLLESEGWKGRVVLLDAVPELLNNLTGINREKFQTKLLCHLLELQEPQDSLKRRKIQTELDKLGIWSEKTSLLLQRSPANSPHSKSYIRELADCTHNRIRATLGYSWQHQGRLVSPVLMVRPSSPALLGLDQEYQLANYCQNPVVVRFVEGTHASILESDDTAVIVSNFLKRGL